MKLIFGLLVLSGVANATLSTLFGNRKGATSGSSTTGSDVKGNQQVIKHLHQHEIKVFHESGDQGLIGGHSIGSGISPSEILLLEGGDHHHHRGGGGVGGVVGSGFGVPHVGVFNSVNAGSFGGGNVGNFESSPGFAYRGAVGASPDAQLLQIVQGENHGNFGGQGYSNFGGGNSGVIPGIVGLIEDGHSHGYGGGGSHQLGNIGGYGNSINPQILTSEVIGAIEDGHSHGYGSGGHAHSIGGQRLTTPQIVGFVEDGISHGYGRYPHGGSNNFGLSGSQIVGFLENENLHGHLGDYPHANSGFNGGQHLHLPSHGWST